MTSIGWIPREMILDTEARSKVPAEFITQHPDVANPPMFFYVIESLMKSTDVGCASISLDIYQFFSVYDQTFSSSCSILSSS